MGSQTDTFSTVHHLPLAALGFVIAPYLTAVLYLEATHKHEEKVFYPHMVGVNLLLSVCANSCHHVCDCRCSLPSLFFTSFFSPSTRPPQAQMHKAFPWKVTPLARNSTS